MSAIRGKATSLLVSIILIMSIITQINQPHTVAGNPDVPIIGAIIIASNDSGNGYNTTHLDGKYLLSQGLPTGSYKVTAMAEGYITKETEGVAVTVGSETKNVNFNLKRSGGVSGKVTDATTGTGLSNVEVIVSNQEGLGWFGLTDSSGNYKVVTNLDTGTYNVTVVLAVGYFTSTVGGISITAGVETKGVNFSLARSGIISGKVLTPAGAPVSGVTVTAISSDGSKNSGVTATNADGSFRIESGLGTGTYTVGVFSGMNFAQVPNVKVEVGKETSNINITLNMSVQLTGEITGKVTDVAGNPISGVHISSGSGYGVTSVDGIYKITTGLPTGTYTVTASAPGYEDKSQSGISVTAGKTTSGINFTLNRIPEEASGRISGIVMGEDNPLTTKQQTSITCTAGKSSLNVGETQITSGAITPSISGTTVSIEYKSGSVDVTRTATTGADGKYSDNYQPTTAGTWTATASWSGDATHAGSISSSTSFTVIQPPTSGNLKVTVLDSGGKPISGVAVTSTSTPSGQSGISGTTASDGTVTFNGVSVGQYTIQAVLTGYTTKSASGQVTAGTTSALSFTLPTSGGTTPPTGGSTSGGVPGFPTETVILGLALAASLLVAKRSKKTQ